VGEVGIDDVAAALIGGERGKHDRQRDEDGGEDRGAAGQEIGGAAGAHHPGRAAAAGKAAAFGALHQDERDQQQRDHRLEDEEEGEQAHGCFPVFRLAGAGRIFSAAGAEIPAFAGMTKVGRDDEREGDLGDWGRVLKGWWVPGAEKACLPKRCGSHAFTPPYPPHQGEGLREGSPSHLGEG
jgi:hypothetical protein